MKQVAVLGATSMLGQALCQQLTELGVGVIRIGRDTGADITFDLADGRFIFPEVKSRAEILFHCAANFADDSELGVAENLRVNSNSAPVVALLAKELGCRQLIYAGTLASAEDFDPAGYSSYGFSKLLAEQQFSWLLKKQNISFCALRFTHLYDTLGRCIKHQPWFGRAVAYAAQGANLNLPEASAMRNFLHVDDAAFMMLQAVKHQVTGTLNALHPQSLTMLELVTLAYRIFERGGRYECNPEKIPFRAMNYPEGSKCWELLDYTPQISFEKIFLQIKQCNEAGRFGPLDVS